MPFSIEGVILKIFNSAAHDILFHVVHNFDKFVFVDVMFTCHVRMHVHMSKAADSERVR